MNTLYTPAQIEQCKQMLEFIDMYNMSRNSPSIIKEWLVTKGIPLDRAEKAIKMVEDAIPMRDFYESVVNSHTSAADPQSAVYVKQ